MSTVHELEEEPIFEAAPSSPRTDTLAASVVILLVMTVAQRAIGFGRGIMFCRWLEPEQLGQWDVAFGFLNLAAPLVVLGLPGSFGRYVEYFRRRGQFHMFLRRTTVVSALMCLAATVAMVVFRQWFSQLIFGSDEESGLVVWLALCLAVIIMHNVLTAMFIAVRMYRIVTLLQFFQSLGFAAISLGLLMVWPLGSTAIVIGYGLATILSAAGSVTWLKQMAAAEPPADAPAPGQPFWGKLIPFAMWMWVTNLLANLFDIVDRYMIVHHSGMASHEALRQVGYYHSSRIVPLLFVAVAGLLGSMITPHLSQDWEAGHREAVGKRLNTVLKVLLGGLFTASIAVLFVAPYLFGVAFQNKFQGGLQVLPLTLTYCAWFGTTGVAQNYLWCAEKARLGSVAFLAGLVVNIVLNILLLHTYGLEGAVWATTAANLVALSLTYLFSRSQGMKVDGGVWVLSLALATLWLGPVIATCVLAALLITTLVTNSIFNHEEKQHLSASGLHALKRFLPRRRARPRAAGAA